MRSWYTLFLNTLTNIQIQYRACHASIFGRQERHPNCATAAIHHSILRYDFYFRAKSSKSSSAKLIVIVLAYSNSIYNYPAVTVPLLWLSAVDYWMWSHSRVRTMYTQVHQWFHFLSSSTRLVNAVQVTSYFWTTPVSITVDGTRTAKSKLVKSPANSWPVTNTWWEWDNKTSELEPPKLS
jgi:hypothetical protein